MSYTPDATDPSEPVDGQKASTAALEFRTLKQYIADQVARTIFNDEDGTVVGNFAANSLTADVFVVSDGLTHGGFNIATGDGTHGGLFGFINPDQSRKGFIGYSLAGIGNPFLFVSEDGASWSFNTSVLAPNIGTNAAGARTISASTPSGGANGDIWYQV